MQYRKRLMYLYKLLVPAYNGMLMMKSSCSDINRPEIQSQKVLVNILFMPSRMLDKEQN
jgi:hypothetical protein